METSVAQDTLRRCYSCREHKPLISFVADKRKPKGRAYLCHMCKYRRLSRESAVFVAAHQARRARRRKGEQITDSDRKKNRANRAVCNAVRAGKLTRRPCEICGRTTGVVAHHDDYNKPLNVRWLCSTHHRAWHLQHGEGLNAGDAP